MRHVPEQITDEWLAWYALTDPFERMAVQAANESEASKWERVRVIEIAEARRRIVEAADVLLVYAKQGELRPVETHTRRNAEDIHD